MRSAVSSASAPTVAILINVLFLQSGPHPAPMRQEQLVADLQSVAAKSDLAAGLPRSRPVATLPAKAEPAAPPRPAVETITDIQRELNRRGFYDGTIDGRYGPKTDAAIRDFEQAAGLKPSTEPNEALLRAIKRLIRQARRRPVRPAMRRKSCATIRSRDILGPSKRVTCGAARARRLWLRPDQADRHTRPRDPGRDREIRARAQAAGHRQRVRSR